MYPPLHADLGKLSARDACSGGFLQQPSGLLRVLGAFCAILGVALLLDAASYASDRSAETIAATGILPQEGR